MGANAILDFTQGPPEAPARGNVNMLAKALRQRQASPRQPVEEVKILDRATGLKMLLEANK